MVDGRRPSNELAAQAAQLGLELRVDLQHTTQHATTASMAHSALTAASAAPGGGHCQQWTFHLFHATSSSSCATISVSGMNRPPKTCTHPRTHPRAPARARMHAHASTHACAHAHAPHTRTHPHTRTRTNHPDTSTHARAYACAHTAQNTHMLTRDPRLYFLRSRGPARKKIEANNCINQGDTGYAV